MVSTKLDFVYGTFYTNIIMDSYKCVSRNDNVYTTDLYTIDRF